MRDVLSALPGLKPTLSLRSLTSLAIEGPPCITRIDEKNWKLVPVTAFGKDFQWNDQNGDGLVQDVEKTPSTNRVAAAFVSSSSLLMARKGPRARRRARKNCSSNVRSATAALSTMRSGAFILAALYAFGSLVLGLAATWCGTALADLL